MAIVAGHFGIFSVGNVPADHLDAETQPAQSVSEFVSFTLLTWDIACQAAASHGCERSMLVVLADDIQYVAPRTSDPRVFNRLGAELARLYFERNRKLPKRHLSALSTSGLSLARIEKNHESQWVFSERELRSNYARRIRHNIGMLAGGNLQLTTNADRTTITLSDSSGASHCIVQSGNASCAGGYAELLSVLRERGFAKIVSLVPMRCLASVSLGSELVQADLSVKLEITNVSIPDVGLGLPAWASSLSGQPENTNSID